MSTGEKMSATRTSSKPHKDARPSVMEELRLRRENTKTRNVDPSEVESALGVKIPEQGDKRYSSAYAKFVDAGGWDAGLMWACLYLDSDTKRWSELQAKLDVDGATIKRQKVTQNPKMSPALLERLAAELGIETSVFVLAAESAAAEKGHREHDPERQKSAVQRAVTRAAIYSHLAIYLRDLPAWERAAPIERFGILHSASKPIEGVNVRAPVSSTAVNFLQESATMEHKAKSVLSIPAGSICEVDLDPSALEDGCVVLVQFNKGEADAEEPTSILAYYNYRKSSSATIETFKQLNNPQLSSEKVAEIVGEELPDHEAAAPLTMIQHRKGTDDPPIADQRAILGRVTRVQYRL